MKPESFHLAEQAVGKKVNLRKKINTFTRTITTCSQILMWADQSYHDPQGYHTVSSVAENYSDPRHLTTTQPSQQKLSTEMKQFLQRTSLLNNCKSSLGLLQRLKKNPQAIRKPTIKPLSSTSSAIHGSIYLLNASSICTINSLNRLQVQFTFLAKHATKIVQSLHLEREQSTSRKKNHLFSGLNFPWLETLETISLRGNIFWGRAEISSTVGGHLDLPQVDSYEWEDRYFFINNKLKAAWAEDLAQLWIKCQQQQKSQHH